MAFRSADPWWSFHQGLGAYNLATSWLLPGAKVSGQISIHNWHLLVDADFCVLIAVRGLSLLVVIGWMRLS